MDVSFISATLVLPAVLAALSAPDQRWHGEAVILIKPQFEAEKSEVGSGGIVIDSGVHERIVGQINSFAEKCGFHVTGVIESPILGAKGNKEFLALYEK